MSLTARLLNAGLRLFEKPYLARVQEPAALRLSLDTKGRFLFPGARGIDARRAELSGIPALWLTPRDPRRQARLLYLHGGGYVFGSARSHRNMVSRIVLRSGIAAVLPDYRLAPEHRFPAAVDDALTAYAALAAEGPVILGGDSAGGGLALALLGQILAKGLPGPRAAFALSPLTDMTFSGQSFRDNARAEALLPAQRAGELAQMYLGDADPADPRASPLFADFTGAPPVWLAAGTTEILLDDTRRMAARMRAQGVEVTETIETDLPHVWPFFQPWLPEARTSLRALADWVSQAAR